MNDNGHIKLTDNEIEEINDIFLRLISGDKVDNKILIKIQLNIILMLRCSHIHYMGICQNCGQYNQGEDRYNAKLKNSDISTIRELSLLGCKNVNIAKEYGVSQSLIGQILNGKSWKRIK